MNATDKLEKKPIVLPCIAGCICILSLLLMGTAAPAFLEMYRDFGIDPLPVPLRVIAIFHWMWTVPVGLLVALVLIWGTRHWSRATNLRIDVTAIVLAITMVVAFAYTILFTRVGGMRTIVPNITAEQGGGNAL